MGWADNQLIATKDSCKDKGCNSMTVRGGRTQPLLMMAIQITHKQEEARIRSRSRAACTAAIHASEQCTAAIYASKQSKIRSSKSGLR